MPLCGSVGTFLSETWKSKDKLWEVFQFEHIAWLTLTAIIFVLFSFLLRWVVLWVGIRGWLTACCCDSLCCVLFCGSTVGGKSINKIKTQSHVSQKEVENIKWGEWMSFVSVISSVVYWISDQKLSLENRCLLCYLTDRLNESAQNHTPFSRLGRSSIFVLI